MNNIQPSTKTGELTRGQAYLYRHRQNGFGSATKLVTFADYTACPGVVIVCDGQGRVFRCLRRDLIAFLGNDETELPQISDVANTYAYPA